MKQNYSSAVHMTNNCKP